MKLMLHILVIIVGVAPVLFGMYLNKDGGTVLGWTLVVMGFVATMGYLIYSNLSEGYKYWNTIKLRLEEEGFSAVPHAVRDELARIFQHTILNQEGGVLRLDGVMCKRIDKLDIFAGLVISGGENLKTVPALIFSRLDHVEYDPIILTLDDIAKVEFSLVAGNPLLEAIVSQRMFHAQTNGNTLVLVTDSGEAVNTEEFMQLVVFFSGVLQKLS